jgi:hypothetical protein
MVGIDKNKKTEKESSLSFEGSFSLFI